MKGKIIIRPKTRDEWLEIRRHGIGSSEVASVVGLNPWASPYQLWLRKTGRTPPQPENEAMRFGHYLEDAVAQMWQNATGAEVIERSKGDWIIRDKERPWLQASPDRTYWSAGEKRNDANKKILEIKSTRMAVDAEDIPMHWFCQVQYLMGVSGYTEGSLAWLSSARGFDFGYRDIHFVPDFYEWISEEVTRFWKDNVLGDKEPEAVSAEDVMLKHPVESAGKLVTATDDVYKAWSELKEVKAELAALEERKERLEERVKLAFGDAERMVRDGVTLATWKAPAASWKFDAKGFAEANPEAARQWTRETRGARRFLVK